MKFKPGDYAHHPNYPDWIWELVDYAEEGGNYVRGVWRLQFVLGENPPWPRRGDRPEVGERRVLAFITLDQINEMELLALVSQ